MQFSSKLISIPARDCEWQYFRGTGAGGQKRNKTSNCVRVVHPPSGAVGEARESRHQSENRRLAWHRMATSGAFLTWIRAQHARAMGIERQAEEEAERQMRNVRVERRGAGGRWEEWSAEGD